jgi:hypothetical protein
LWAAMRRGADGECECCNECGELHVDDGWYDDCSDSEDVKLVMSDYGWYAGASIAVIQLSPSRQARDEIYRPVCWRLITKWSFEPQTPRPRGEHNSLSDS